jgi:uncharacterized protein DUF4907
MTIKHNTIVLAISIAVAAIIPFYYLGQKKKVDYKIFHTTSGWGYDILVGKKLFIHQECVPVLAEKKGFTTEESARAVATIVVHKLKNNEMPTLTCSELSQVFHN